MRANDKSSVSNKMDDKHEKHSLVHGCDIISRRLRFLSFINGRLYSFDSTSPHRPRPLSLFVVLLSCLPPFIVLFGDLLAHVLASRKVSKFESEYEAISQSVFINRMSRFFGLYRLATSVAFPVILLATHGSFASTIASGNQFVSKREQAHLARRTLRFYLLKTLSGALAYLASLSAHHFNSQVSSLWFDLIALSALYLLFLFNLTTNAPLIYTCYLSSALGRHVENFSAMHVDTMFDQFMLAIEKSEDSEEGHTALEIGDGRGPNDITDSNPLDTNSAGADQQGAPQANAEDEDEMSMCCMTWCCVTLYRHVAAVFRCICRFVAQKWRVVVAIKNRLALRKYPELPEMKMTKLSSTTDIQISETMRAANCHLIRVRLRRTQIMLSELRDIVSDINKTSSPIVLIYLVYETTLIILITTASIQAKVYKSVSILIAPTILITLGLTANVVFLCTCMDQTTKQLKLLINKLFDFIIMNHRVRSTGKRAVKDEAQIHSDNSEVCLISGSEDGAINETWSQFQYTRKLANTIQFTMGGILPVTRRLVLSILGHILSAVFISIEIMSIIDTLNTPHDGHSAKSLTNNSSTQYAITDFLSAHHMFHKGNN